MVYALYVKKHFVSISEMKTSDDASATITTHSLGSCIGVTVHDPVACVGGMLHYQLPTGRANPEKAAANPFMFGDTGVDALFSAVFDLGGRKDRIIVKVAGGAAIMDKDGTFNIGQRNYLILKKILWKNGIMIAAEDVGGNTWRNMTLDIGSGRVWIKKSDGIYELK